MAASRIPGNVQLAPGESPLVDDRFMFSTLAFFLYTDLALTNRRFLASRPTTVLGLIPVGTSRSSYPIDNIAGVNAGTRFDFLGVIFGAFAVVIGLAALTVPTAGPLGLLLVILGTAAVAGAPKQFVQVQNSGGGTVTFPVSVFERGRTLEFASRVSEAIARTSRAGASAEPATAARGQSGDAASGLRQLEQLRSQGLITDAEYAAKRSDILARL